MTLARWSLIPLRAEIQFQMLSAVIIMGGCYVGFGTNPSILLIASRPISTLTNYESGQPFFIYYRRVRCLPVNVKVRAFHSHPSRCTTVRTQP